MSKLKELNAIKARLKALLARGDISPEQKQHVAAALKEVKRLGRRSNATRHDVFSCVREVAERLLRAFYGA